MNTELGIEMASNTLTMLSMTFCKANGRQKCVEYLMENDRNIDENVCVKPNEKSYEYALSKLLKQVETFKKVLTGQAQRPRMTVN